MFGDIAAWKNPLNILMAIYQGNYEDFPWRLVLFCRRVSLLFWGEDSPTKFIKKQEKVCEQNMFSRFQLKR